MINIAIMASGGGSNAEVLVNYFQENSSINVSVILCNNKNAGVVDRAKRLNIPLEYISKETLSSEVIITLLNQYDVNFIVLAGFLLKIPALLVSTFPNKIINIHPALLPNYGGKGMYGNHVHQAVLNNNESESGITIHLVNENYDEGAVLFQAKVPIIKNETVESLANKIHVLEHENYAKVIEKYIASKAI